MNSFWRSTVRPPTLNAVDNGNPMKNDPPRPELWFRLIFSLVGLGLMVFAVGFHGIAGMAWFEIVGFGSVFFGGTALWAGLKLLGKR